MIPLIQSSRAKKLFYRGCHMELKTEKRAQRHFWGDGSVHI